MAYRSVFDCNALGVALLTACLASPAAFAAPKEEKVRYVPFNANVKGTELVYPNVPNAPQFPNPNGCVAVGLPYGVVNLIGNSTASGVANDEAVALAATDCIAAVFPAAEMPPALSVFRKGRLVLTAAADGAKLEAEYSGALLPTETPSVYAVEGRYVLTGGTKRFSEAGGYGELRGKLTISPDGPVQVQYQLSGKISN